MAPGVNPVYLTGSVENWPLGEIAATGCGSLEITPECLTSAASWKPAADRAGLSVVAVNAMPDLWPYLTGSLSDAVAWRRADTIDRLTAALGAMRRMGVPYLIVAPSRLAEVYQTPDEARALLLDALRRLSDAAGPVTVLLEGAPLRIYSAPADIAGVIDEVARPNVAAALNVGHARLMGHGLASAVRALGARLRYVQIHDADVRPGCPRLDRHLPLGAGALNASSVRVAIGDRPFAFTVCAPEDPIGALRASVEWLCR